MSKRNVILNIAFLLIVIIELLGRLTDQIALEYLSKPFIMLWIAVYFILNTKKRSLLVGVLFAFFFSWVGDMFLMFSGGYDNEVFFYAGVAGFFIAQVFYIFVFLLNKENNIKGFLLRNPLWVLPLFAYGIFIYLLLYPGLEGIMVPIILVYAISLIGMSLSALNRRDRVGIKSFQLVFTGSLFFVVSDSMIAINKFYKEFSYSGFLIMLTYIIAQYLIMRGLLLEKEKPTDP